MMAAHKTGSRGFLERVQGLLQHGGIVCPLPVLLRGIEPVAEKEKILRFQHEGSLGVGGGQGIYAQRDAVADHRFFGYAISCAQLFAGIIAQIQLFGLQKGGVSHMVGVEVGNDGADGAGERMQFFQHMISVACIKEAA